jgi:aminoglycoside 3-N-acetyltransferase
VSHEIGNKSIRVHRDDVADGARSVGIVPGDTMMFHSSLSSMGTVVGGPDTVIDGFLDAVGPEGTVAVPTLWFHHTDPPMQLEDFDIDTSPSYPGAITEHFRQRPDSVRSNNPTHSISAIGARAEELTRDHGKAGLRLCVFGNTAFAAESPWQKLYEWDAAYCFLGVDFTYNTMGHFVQAVLVERAINGAAPDRCDALAARVWQWDQPGVWPNHSFQAMGERLAEMGLVRFGKIGSATLRCIRAHVMVDTILAILEDEPEAWLDADFRAWLSDAQQP